MAVVDDNFALVGRKRQFRCASAAVLFHAIAKHLWYLLVLFPTAVQFRAQVGSAFVSLSTATAVPWT